MSQDSIFNVQPGGNTTAQPNPFKALSDDEQTSAPPSPFAAVQTQDAPLASVEGQANIPEPRKEVEGAPHKLQPVQESPFHPQTQAQPVQDLSPFQVRNQIAKENSPFEMTGLGVNGSRTNEFLAGETTSPLTVDTPFAAVEAPLEAENQPQSQPQIQPTEPTEPVVQQGVPASPVVAAPINEVGGFQIPKESEIPYGQSKQPEEISEISSPTPPPAYREDVAGLVSGVVAPKSGDQGQGTQLEAQAAGSLASPAALKSENPVTNQPKQSQNMRARGAMKQLELRAIFGVNHELSAEEILQRARSLPGVRNIARIDAKGAQALSILQESVQQVGFSDQDEVGLYCPGGMIDFITENESAIAILHEGEYAPGIRETLIIACREIANLS